MLPQRQRHIIFTFRRWSGKSYAVFNSLFSLIRIGVLAFTFGFILKMSPLKAQNRDTMEVRMEMDLEEVEIVATSVPEVYSQVARSITILNAETIASSPAFTLQELLETIPGLDIRQRNSNGVQADIQLRGGSFDQVMILLNGININDPQTGHFHLNLPVELSMIERVEVLHGSAARIYGANAYKGVINIITRKKWEGVSGGIQLGENGLNHSHAEMAISPKNHYHWLGASANNSKGYTDNTDYSLRNVYYRGGVEMKSLDLNWQGGINNKKFGANDFYSPRFPDQYEETVTRFASLAFSLKILPVISGNAYYRQHRDHFLLVRSNPDFYENFHLTNVFGGRIQTSFSSIAGISTIGLNYRHENILSNTLGNELDEPVQVQGEKDEFFRAGFSRFNSSITLDQKFLLDGFYISAGFLLNYNPEYQESIQFFPGADLSWYPFNRDFKVIASVSRSLRLPTFTDMFYSDPSNMGSPGLVPEELIAMESGIVYKHGNITSRLTIFHDMGKNSIDWTMVEDDSVYRAGNVAEIRTLGIETSVTYLNESSEMRPGVKSAGLGFSKIGQNISEGSWESKYAGDFLKNKFQADIHSQIYKKLYFDLNLAYYERNGSYPDWDQDRSLIIKRDFSPYLLTDIKLSWISDKWSIYTQVSNLFDVEYNDVGNLIQPGRWIRFGIEVRKIKKK